jgi:uncharacterized protein YjhX (UPF0386 family)
MRSSERFSDLNINGHFTRRTAYSTSYGPRRPHRNPPLGYGKTIDDARCFTRDGWLYPGFGLDMFRKLKRKKAISSSGGKPYRITQRGLVLVRSQLNNR